MHLLRTEPPFTEIKLNGAGKIAVLRLDLMHPVTGGNKWFKLKRNVEAAKQAAASGILTFGGAHSNHLAATAVTCALEGIRSAAVVTGYRQTSPSLEEAGKSGMQLFFANGKIKSPSFEETLMRARDFCQNYYEVPMGGANAAGVAGAAEIAAYLKDYDTIVCACGTATTFAGILCGLSGTQRVIGISALKGKNTLAGEAMTLAQTNGCGTLVSSGNTDSGSFITNDFAFSGFGKFDLQLVACKRAFESRHGIPLDYLYMPRVFFAAEDMMRKGIIGADEKVAVVHSGGLQGNRGFETRFGSQLNNH